MPTMKDVAKKAGVSLGTVSRVINHASGIKPTTLAKVQRAIEELNYIPDQYARGLKIQRSMTIALMVPTIWNSFNAEFAYHVEKALDQQGYKMLLCDYDADPKRELDYIQMVKENKIDAIIGITYGDIDKYVDSRLPFISIDRYYKQRVSYVASQNYEGGRMAAAELLKHGARHLAFVGSYNQYPNDTRRRYEGFCDYLKERELPILAIRELEPVASFFPLLDQLFDQHPEIDGLFCNTDTLLYDVWRWCYVRGVEVPQRLQLIGYDGMRQTEHQRLPVSTIAQPIKAMAEMAVKLALDKLENPMMKEKHIFFPVKFVEGFTTKNNRSQDWDKLLKDPMP